MPESDRLTSAQRNKPSKSRRALSSCDTNHHISCGNAVVDGSDVDPALSDPLAMLNVDCATAIDAVGRCDALGFLL